MTTIANTSNLMGINSMPLPSYEANTEKLNLDNKVSDVARSTLQQISMKLTLFSQITESLCRQLEKSNAKIEELCEKQEQSNAKIETLCKQLEQSNAKTEEMRAGIEQKNNNNKPCAIPPPPPFPEVKQQENSNRKPCTIPPPPPLPPIQKKTTETIRTVEDEIKDLFSKKGDAQTLLANTKIRRTQSLCVKSNENCSEAKESTPEKELTFAERKKLFEKINNKS